MNVKIQGGGKNAGVYANTGSAAALVRTRKGSLKGWIFFLSSTARA